jgi:hypothetical protein
MPSRSISTQHSEDPGSRGHADAPTGHRLCGDIATRATNHAQLPLLAAVRPYTRPRPARKYAAQSRDPASLQNAVNRVLAASSRRVCRSSAVALQRRRSRARRSASSATRARKRSSATTSLDSPCGGFTSLSRASSDRSTRSVPARRRRSVRRTDRAGFFPTARSVASRARRASLHALFVCRIHAGALPCGGLGARGAGFPRSGGFAETDAALGAPPPKARRNAATRTSPSLKDYGR